MTIVYDGVYFGREPGKVPYPTYDVFNRTQEHDGERWQKLNAQIAQGFDCFGKRILEVGCAFGYLVTDFNNLGISTRGIDSSEYCIANKEHANVSLNDMTTLTGIRRGDYDLILGVRVLECLTDDQIVLMKDRIRAICDRASFIVDNSELLEGFGTEFLRQAREFYNIKSLEEWRSLLSPYRVESSQGALWQLP